MAKVKKATQDISETELKEVTAYTQAEVTAEPQTPAVAEVKQSTKSLVLSSGSVQYMSSDEKQAQEDKSLVNVQIKYPAEYPKRKRFHKEGHVYSMSSEVAEVLNAKGIGEKI